MTDWIKEIEHGGFVKTGKLHDGKVISLLLSGEGLSSEVVLERSYPSFVDLDEARNRAFGLILAAFALAFLSYFEIVQSFSNAGLEIGSSYLKHISLILGALSGIYFSVLDSKHMYFKVWFDHIFLSAEPPRRSHLLLCYPRAFDVVKFAETSVGFPKNVHPTRSRVFLPFAVVSLIMIVLVLIGSFTLYAALAVDVWNSGVVSPIVSQATVVASALVSILSLTFPKHYPFKRTYRHYGLSNTIGNLRDRNPDRAQYFSRRIAEIRIRMGLTKV